MNKEYLAWFFVTSVDREEVFLLEKTITLPIEPSKGMEIVISGDSEPLVIETVRVDLMSGKIELKITDDNWKVEATREEIEKYIAECYGDWEVK